MTNEEFQKQVMEKLESLETRMSGIENGLGGIEGRMTGIESKVAELPTRQELHAVVAEQQKTLLLCCSCWTKSSPTFRKT
jgi:hypothetical protein